ncbi:cytochrome ubiquinol oxidase subunit I [Aeromicrobium sp. 9AM]|uniref:cytochrome ubiquinol oxidase subunit I n=1 Tax=Aeromicrobium sp. 9AM TaxID=2653126 RepID=UPI0012EF46C8|nr:cytochrome ubiquinol oxidase subunit I [Aeromicrobium sp. 9AM]VXC11702.1 cytochrome bb' ubiquinol oxidase (subunit I) [Aeromicrobium sp. 9AM]
MEALDLARWQFGITTVYHFFFVPITIGLSFLVAGLQTAWWRTANEKYLRLTKFFGKLFLINFALGVATGIVQEFQFGMNWSDYSRFVGDIFGAPLAIEGLLAFFLESTFLGLWIFGWDKLKPGVHLATIWIAAIGTLLSSYFILAANSFMQNPVGFRFNSDKGRAELTDFGAVLTNKVALVTVPHTIFACFMVGGAFMAGIAMWHVVRHPDRDRDAFRTAVRLGAVTLFVAGLGVVVTGDIQGKIMTDVQPMKMAAAEGLYETQQPAGFSLFEVGTLDGSKSVYKLEVPKLLSYLGTGDVNGQVKGINDLQAEYEKAYGPGDYSPNIPVTYWTFRAMITVGGLAMLAAAAMLWATRGGRVPTSRWMLRTAIVLPFLPLIGNSFGWIFTEMGRQPWVVFGVMPTSAGVSPGTTTAEVLLSLIAFTVVYGVLAIVEFKLLLTYIRAGLPVIEPVGDDADDDRDAPLAFAY